MDRIDVVVIGGGPAGAAAATAAANGGAAVVLVEKGVPRADRAASGPDSTDAAGILDYWVELMGIDPAEFPEDVVLRELNGAEFISPHERLLLEDTGMDSTYPHFGFTYDRTRFDDWMLERAAAAGADCRIGTPVASVTSTTVGEPTHEVALRDGTSVEANAVILADGPQRSVTLPVLAQFLPEGRAEAVLDATRTNHIAYQEYRRFPAEVFEPTRLKFWWGHMPGHTAYPWVFPNDDTVARVGLTMPIGLDVDAIPDRDAYVLLRADDDQIPSGAEYIRRLLTHVYGDRYDVDDFPRVTDRGKRDGTETYPISSTQPIDSPVGANIAVVGGAMGATSAFHEGGGHVAVRTGTVAGELAAQGDLGKYNRAWKDAIGAEVRRNLAMADLVVDFGPADWDQAFRIARQLQALGTDRGISVLRAIRVAGLAGLRLAADYRWNKVRYRDGQIVQLHEDEYAL